MSEQSDKKDTFLNVAWGASLGTITATAFLGAPLLSLAVTNLQLAFLLKKKYRQWDFKPVKFFGGLTVAFGVAAAALNPDLVTKQNELQMQEFAQSSPLELPEEKAVSYRP